MAVVGAPFLRGSFAWRLRHANAACILRAFVGGLWGAGGGDVKGAGCCGWRRGFFCFDQVGAE